MNGTRKCVIFTGGAQFYPERIDFPVNDGDFVIAADSGCKNLFSYCEKVKRISPDIILGDMDSYDGDIKNDFPDARFISFPPEKDDTDTSLAVKFALEKGFCDIVIMGGLGGRLDHTLANAFLLEYIKDKGAKGIITDGKNITFLAENKNFLEKGSKKYVSVIPLDREVERVTMRGFKYNMNKEKLQRCFFITVSNEFVSQKAIIEIDGGSALIILSED